jgi:MscS family membrane protein
MMVRIGRSASSHPKELYAQYYAKLSPHQSDLRRIWLSLTARYLGWAPTGYTMKYFHLCLTLFLLVIVSAQANAQDAAPPVADEPPVMVADPLDRGSPRRSADGFLAVVDAGDYETAAEYMDLRNLRGEATELTGAQLARRFVVIIARADWIDVGDLVDDPAGRKNDNLPSYRDSIGIILEGDKEHQLFMQKVPRGDGVSIWKISNATVSLIPTLYTAYGYPEIIEDLRRSLPHAVFLGFELFKWVTIILVALFAYMAVFLLALIVRRALGEPDTLKHQRIYTFLTRPFGIWVVIILMNAAATALGRGITAEAIQQYSPITTLITLWMMFGGMNLLRDLYAEHLQQRDRPGAAVLLRPVTTATKLLIAVGALLIYLDGIGINITTVLAGLGVGGVAVALALQKPMEDVFGALTLYTQQPVRVGDFCQVGKYTGTIEEIGLRTTRLRTIANTLIAIPNARLANEPIDNISERSKILYQPTLRLKYDTSPEQLRSVLSGVREMLTAHDQVLQDSHRVRFQEIAEDALLIEVFAYLDTISWAMYLELAEGINIQILEIVAQAGTTLALPSRTLHMEQISQS